MRKVTIELEWMDAVTLESMLDVRHEKNAKMKKLFQNAGDPVPLWLTEDIKKTTRILDIVKKAVHSE